MKEKYTVDIHVKRLEGMLASKKKLEGCPAAPYYNPDLPASAIWSQDSRPCKVCLEFVGIDYHKHGHICPCHYFKDYGGSALAATYRALANYYERKEINNERNKE